MRIMLARVKKTRTNAWQKSFCTKLTSLDNFTEVTGLRIKHGMMCIHMVLTLIPLPRLGFIVSRRK